MEGEILFPEIRSYGISAIDHKPKAAKISRSKRLKARTAAEFVKGDEAEKKSRKASPDPLIDRNLYAPQHDDDDAGKIMESPDSAYSEKLDVGKNGRMVPPGRYNLSPKPHRRT